MYKLYGRPGSGSVVVEAMLEAAGAPYEVELVERTQGGRIPQNIARINPLGQVPARRCPTGRS